MQKDHSQAAYTQGPIARTMLKTGAAMLVGTLAMSGYNLADAYFVGKLPGVTPLAAMGFTMPVIMLVGCLFRGLSVGVMTTTAQSLGAGERDRAARFITSGLLLVLVVSLVIGSLGCVFGGEIMRLFGAQGEALTEARGYMDIWFLGCATAFLSMTANDLLIAAGANRIASAMMMAGMVINMILDPWFIFGGWGVPAMGIRGAAVATIGSQLVATVTLLFILARRLRLLKFEPIPKRRLTTAWMHISRYALPAMLGMLMMPIGSAVVTRITACFGDAAVAATAAAGRLEMFAFVVPMALGMTLMPMAGQNFGARLYSRIRECRHFAMFFAGSYLLAMAVIYTCFAPYIVPWFSASDEVQQLMVLCLRITAWGFAGIEIHRYSGFFYTACGHPVAAACLNAFRIIGLMIPLSLLALHWNNIALLFGARLAADVVAGSVGFWLTHLLTHAFPTDGDASAGGTGLPQLFHLRWFAHAQTELDSKSSTQ